MSGEEESEVGRFGRGIDCGAQSDSWDATKRIL
jgi:hypothetical protein